MSEKPTKIPRQNTHARDWYDYSNRLERERNEAQRERDVFKLEMWKARNAVEALAGATRHLLADFKGFKYAAKEIHDFGKSHGNYSIERAEKTLEKVRSLAAVSVKGGEA